MKKGLMGKIGFWAFPVVASAILIGSKGDHKIPKPYETTFNGNNVTVSRFIEGGNKVVKPDGTTVNYLFLPYTDMGDFSGKENYHLTGFVINGKYHGMDEDKIVRAYKPGADSLLDHLDSLSKAGDQ